MHNASRPSFLHCKQGCNRSHFNFLRLHSKHDFVGRARLRLVVGFGDVGAGGVRSGVAGAGLADMSITDYCPQLWWVGRYVCKTVKQCGVYRCDAEMPDLSIEMSRYFDIKSRETEEGGLSKSGNDVFPGAG